MRSRSSTYLSCGSTWRAPAWEAACSRSARHVLDASSATGIQRRVSTQALTRSNLTCLLAQNGPMTHRTNTDQFTYLPGRYLCGNQILRHRRDASSMAWRCRFQAPDTRVDFHTGRDAERLEEGLPGELQTRRLRVAVGDKKAERRRDVARPQHYTSGGRSAHAGRVLHRAEEIQGVRAAAAWSPCSLTSMLTLKNTETKLSPAESAPPEARPPPDPPRTPHPAQRTKG